MRSNLIKVAKEIFESKYPDARVLFLAGSIVRGEGTPHSDLDLVVIFNELPNAYRESFHFQRFPVEAFVHDPETLNYFLFEVDRPTGIPSLAQMILEGIELPEPNEVSQSLKQLAATVMEAGPPALSAEEVLKLRYNLTNLVDDVRQPRSREEWTRSSSDYPEPREAWPQKMAIWVNLLILLLCGILYSLATIRSGRRFEQQREKVVQSIL